MEHIAEIAARLVEQKIMDRKASELPPHWKQFLRDWRENGVPVLKEAMKNG